jgi:hypothetical protein
MSRTRWLLAKEVMKTFWNRCPFRKSGLVQEEVTRCEGPQDAIAIDDRSSVQAMR